MDLFRSVRSINIDRKRIMAFGVAAFVLGLLFGNVLVYISGPQSLGVDDRGEEALSTPDEEAESTTEEEDGEVISEEEVATEEGSASEEESEASSEGEGGDAVSEEEAEAPPEEGVTEDFPDEEYVARLVASYIPESVRSVCGSYLSFQMAKAMDEGEPGRTLGISIRFSHELSDSEVKDVEALGISFYRLDGEVLHAGVIYSASGSVEAINELAQWEIVVSIESTSTPIELP